jgi:UDP-N-acetylglucosamine 2-epimerase
MKAVLEYTYPQDEDKLKHALKGEEYYLALVDIKRTTNWTTVHMEEMLDRICEVLDGVLNDEH